MWKCVTQHTWTDADNSGGPTKQLVFKREKKGLICKCTKIENEYVSGLLKSELGPTIKRMFGPPAFLYSLHLGTFAKQMWKLKSLLSLFGLFQPILPHWKSVCIIKCDLIASDISKLHCSNTNLFYWKEIRKISLVHTFGYIFPSFLSLHLSLFFPLFQNSN